VNLVKWKPLLAVLLGLLMVGVTAGDTATSVMPTSGHTIISYVTLDGMAFKVYNNSKVALDDKGPSKYYTDIEKLPIHIAGMRLSEKIYKQYMKYRYVSQNDLDALIELAEKVTRKLSPSEEQILKDLILRDLYMDQEFRKMKEQLIHENWDYTARIEATNSQIPPEVQETLPKIYQPWVDILPQGDQTNPSKGLNPLIAVYWYVHETQSGKVIEYTLVFADEDHPLIDQTYDVIRLWRFGRIEDTEYYLVYVTTNKAKFPGSYSGDQTFFTIRPAHLTGSEPYSGKIYINTWNHMMSSQKDTNPQLIKKTWQSYPLRHGDRHKAHCDYSFKC